MRRQGGSAALLPLCVLYAALARRVGLPLELVMLELPTAPRGAAAGAAGAAGAAYPTYLLRLPAQGEQADVYIDVLANGRLRMPWDLAAFAHGAPGFAEAHDDKDALKVRMRQYVRELPPAAFCTCLVAELADACAAADSAAEAAFWSIQANVLERALDEAHRLCDAPP